VATPSARS